MGIPGLQRRLEPFTADFRLLLHSSVPPTCLPLDQPGEPNAPQQESSHSFNLNSSAPLTPRKIFVVVDGPALAYHAYHIASCKLSQKEVSAATPENAPKNSNSSRLNQTLRNAGQNAPNATPSSRDVVDALLAWLDALASVSFQTKHDGIDGVIDGAHQNAASIAAYGGREEKSDSGQHGCRRAKHGRADDGKELEVPVKVEIKGIFFDGGLPEGKRLEREGRLRRRILDLVAVRRRAPGMEKYAFDEDESEEEQGTSCESRLNVSWNDLNFGRRGLRSPNLLPYPWWIAIAALDGLRSSKYSSICHRVPGEADPFCAGLAARLSESCTKDDKVIVVTGDSDFLVYDMGAYSEVVFLNDICFRDADVNMVTFPVRRIAERILKPKVQNGCSSIPLAYLVSQNEHISDSKLGHMALELQSNSEKNPEYTLFRDEYQTKVIGSIYLDPKLERAVQRLDTCLSELHHMAKPILGIDAPNQLMEEQGLCIYLPLLSEDPDRSSAWQAPDETIRQLTYKLLLYAFGATSNTPHNIQVDEIRRRSQDITKHRISPLGHPDMLTNLTNLEALLRVETSSRTCIRELGLRQLLRQLPPASGKRQLTALFGGTFVPSWSHIHLAACMQAHMYAHRMLLQALEVFLASLVATPGPCERFGADNISTCERIRDMLRDMGCDDLGFIVDPLPPPQDEVERRQRTNIIERICVEFNICENEDGKKPSKKNRKRKGQAEKSDALNITRIRPKRLSTNRFDMLDEE